MTLGVALGGHVHPYEDLLALVERAEALGYRAAFVDGDASMRPSRPAAEVLDGWTVTTALLARTRRIEIGSIRLVHHWNAARLAQAVASAERLTPGRLRFLISIGGQAADARFGLPLLSARERIAWLDETLGVLRALWAGERVSLEGRYVRLAGARVRPLPRGGRMSIAVAARRPRLLELVAAHADEWEMNLPPVRARVEAAARVLEDACRRRGRDPESIRRSMWIFTRVTDGAPGSALATEFRRLNPWFSDLDDHELPEALVVGPPEACRERLAAIRRELGLELPVLDLSGLARPAAERVMEALAPGETRVDARV